MVTFNRCASKGNAESDNNPALGEVLSLESYLDFTASANGWYKLAVCGAGNEPDPDFGSTSLGSTGEYDLTIEVSDGERRLISHSTPRFWTSYAVHYRPMSAANVLDWMAIEEFTDDPLTSVSNSCASSTNGLCLDAHRSSRQPVLNVLRRSTAAR